MADSAPINWWRGQGRDKARDRERALWQCARETEFNSQDASTKGPVGLTYSDGACALGGRGTLPRQLLSPAGGILPALQPPGNSRRTRASRARAPPVPCCTPWPGSPRTGPAARRERPAGPALSMQHGRRAACAWGRGGGHPSSPCAGPPRTGPCTTTRPPTCTSLRPRPDVTPRLCPRPPPPPHSVGRPASIHFRSARRPCPGDPAGWQHGPARVERPGTCCGR
jgi:hypothetical protein